MKRTIKPVLIAITAVLLFSCGSLQQSADRTSEGKTEDGSESTGTAGEDPFELLKQGDKEALNTLLQQGLDVSRKDEDGATLLHYAVWYGYDGLASLLIERGADVGDARKDGYTPLHWAAYKGRPEAAAMLLAGGAEVNATAETGATPLHLAAWKGHTDTAIELLNAGASLRLRKTEGNTPTDLASSEGAEETEDLLALARKYGNERGVVAFRYGEDAVPLYDTYGESLLTTIDEQGEEALAKGEPELPPYGLSSLQIDKSFDYTEKPYFAVRVENTGKGALFRLGAEFTLRPSLYIETKNIYFGKVGPGETVERRIGLPALSTEKIDTEIEVEVAFSELNQYSPPAQKGKLTINPVDKSFVYEKFLDLPVADIKTILDKGFVTKNDVEEIMSSYKDRLDSDRLTVLLTRLDLDKEFNGKIVLNKSDLFELQDVMEFHRQGVVSLSTLTSFVTLYRDTLTVAEIKKLLEDVSLPPDFTGKLVLHRGGELGTSFVGGLYRDKKMEKNDFESYIARNRDSIETDEFIDTIRSVDVSKELVRNFIFYKKDADAYQLSRLVRYGGMSRKDVGRYVLINGKALSRPDLRVLTSRELIGRTEVDKLVRFERTSYSMGELKHFAEKNAISQDVLEYVIVNRNVSFKPDDIVALAELNYISRRVVEALYLDGIGFSSKQVGRLMDLGVFTRPQILYTYTINDGDSDTSVGNKDGMIQVREGVDFTYIIKNDSVFDLEDVTVDVRSRTNKIDVFFDTKTIKKMAHDETVKVTSTIAVKPGFNADAFGLSLEVSNRFFGPLLSVEERIAVGREVGDMVLTLNKRVVSTDPISVYSGASDETPRIASLSEGAVFNAVGELGSYYKVKVLGQYGWVAKEMTEEYSDDRDDLFVVENISEDEFENPAIDEWEVSAGTVAWEEVDNQLEEAQIASRAFVNAKPELVVLSPKNNDEVYNEITLELIAIDNSFGIESIDIRVNGKRLPGSTERGLKVTGGKTDTVHKSYQLKLAKGQNRVDVTAYNKKNIASQKKTVHLTSLGVKNPPRLFVLSVGVSEYEDPRQNLTYADSDARSIVDVFEGQRDSGLYDDVRTKLLVNEEATRENIKNGINYFLSDARSHDMAVLFFAGHGTTDDRGRYYFLGHDADLDKPSANGIKESDFGDDLVASIQAKKVMVMLDSCHSGGVSGRRGAENITEVVEKLAGATGFTFMSAARENEYAYEDPSWRSGAFTLAVKEGLQLRKADRDGNGYIGINELNRYVYDRVVELTDSKQHPSISGRGIESFDFFAVE